jgi:hypothetical protein
MHPVEQRWPKAPRARVARTSTPGSLRPSGGSRNPLCTSPFRCAGANDVRRPTVILLVLAASWIKPRRFWLALVVVIAVGSFQAAPVALAGSRGRYLTGSFSQRTVQRFTNDLAKAGVGVYPVGGSRPVRRVAGRTSPLHLTTAQVRTVALGVWSDSGLSGATLTGLAGPMRLTARVSVPVGAVIAGWAKRVRSPSARLARRILGPVNWRHYKTIVFPNAVVMLFASDVALNMPTSGTPLTGSLAAGLAHPAAARPCTAILTSVNDTVIRVFDLIGHVKTDEGAIRKLFGNGFVGSIIKGVGDVLAKEVNTVIDGARAIVLGGVQVPIKALTNSLAAVAGAATLIDSVANVLAPWSGRIIADPNPIAKGVGTGIPGKFVLNVTAPLSERNWAPWVRDCAGLFGVPLPELTPTGAKVEWDASDQQPVPLIIAGQASGPLNEGRAQLPFQTTTETPEEAKGELTTGSVLVTATVHRTDLDVLRDRLTRSLLNALPSVIYQLASKEIQAAIQPMVNSVTSKIATLRDVVVSGSLAVDYHQPRTVQTWDGAWASAIYPIAGTFLLRFSRDGNGNTLSGSVRIAGSRCVSGGAINGSIVDDQIRFGIVRAQAAIAFTGQISARTMAGTWAAAGCGKDSGTWHAKFKIPPGTNSAARSTS